jgi:hypothetical protein
VCVILSWFKIALAIVVTSRTFILWENVIAKQGPRS